VQLITVYDRWHKDLGYAGRLAGGTPIRTSVSAWYSGNEFLELAAANGLSPESAGMVLLMLACEGLVSMQEGGDGVRVLPRYTYRTEVRVAPTGAVIPTPAERRRLVSAIRKAVQAEPAIIRRDMRADADGAVCAFSVEAADIGRAIVIALAVVRAAQDSGWSWDGWDLAGAAITAALEPSEQDGAPPI
jgi:hypothetical protein